MYVYRYIQIDTCILTWDFEQQSVGSVHTTHTYISKYTRTLSLSLCLTHTHINTHTHTQTHTHTYKHTHKHTHKQTHKRTHTNTHTQTHTHTHTLDAGFRAAHCSGHAHPAHTHIQTHTHTLSLALCLSLSLFSLSLSLTHTYTQTNAPDAGLRAADCVGRAHWRNLVKIFKSQRQNLQKPEVSCILFSRRKFSRQFTW